MTRERTDLGLLIIEYRKKARMSQIKLALEAHITPASLARIESGETKYPRTETLATICEALNLKEKDRLKLVASLLAPLP